MDENQTTNKNKKLIIAVIAAIVAIVVILGIVNLVKPTPEKTVKNFVKYMNDSKISKALDLVDMVGMGVFDEDDVKSFNDDYEDAVDDLDDDEVNEKVDKMVEKLEDEISDYNQFSLEIKSIKSAKKVSGAKNLYKVKAKIKSVVKEDEDSKTNRSTDDITFYVFKAKNKYKIVGIEGKFLDF